MATYVTSDAHGHVRALDRALEMAQPGPRDSIFVLGDMVDRGPEPLGVVRLVRSLSNAHALMGNHEAMLLETILEGGDLETMSWHMNGGFVTSGQLDALPREEFSELLDWLAALPTFAVVDVDDARRSSAPGARRTFLLCHAGINAARLRSALGDLGVVADEQGGYGDATPDELLDAMVRQDIEDLLWIRGGFWSEPTGLVGRDGKGPVVIAGHTPSVLLGRYASLMCGKGADEDLRGVMVEVGATSDTGGVADRVCIDCSAAVGHPSGRVGVMRLEDRRVWLSDVDEGE